MLCPPKFNLGTNRSKIGEMPTLSLKCLLLECAFHPISMLSSSGGNPFRDSMVTSYRTQNVPKTVPGARIVAKSLFSQLAPNRQVMKPVQPQSKTENVKSWGNDGGTEIFHSGVKCSLCGHWRIMAESYAQRLTKARSFRCSDLAGVSCRDVSELGAQQWRQSEHSAGQDGDFDNWDSCMLLSSRNACVLDSQNHCRLLDMTWVDQYYFKDVIVKTRIALRFSHALDPILLTQVRLCPCG